jgi:hypothetical protein
VWLVPCFFVRVGFRRSDHLIDNPRITKSEQVSKSRYHQEVKLQSPDDVDAELLVWLKTAYHLSGG